MGDGDEGQAVLEKLVSEEKKVNFLVPSTDGDGWRKLFLATLLLQLLQLPARGLGNATEGRNCTCAKKRCKISPPFLLQSYHRYPIDIQYRTIGKGSNNSYLHLLPIQLPQKGDTFTKKMSDMIFSTYAPLHSAAAAAAAASSSPSSWLLAKKNRERSCTRTLGMRQARIILSLVAVQEKNAVQAFSVQKDQTLFSVQRSTCNSVQRSEKKSVHLLYRDGVKKV